METLKRLLIAATTVCALAACGSSVAAPGSTPAGAAGTRCGPSAAKTLAASRDARVYVQSGSVYGCAARGRGRYRLGHSLLCVNSDRVGPVTVAGRLAAFAVTRCGVDTGSATVVVRRLSDGAHLFSHVAANPSGPEGYISVTSIVATSKGAVAWIARASSIVSHHTVMGVFVRHGAGVSQLDSGSGIVADSLQLKGSALSWSDSSGRRSARLS